MDEQTDEKIVATITAEPAHRMQHEEALAGALPEWDLLPEAAFVRRC